MKTRKIEVSTVLFRKRRCLAALSKPRQFCAQMYAATVASASNRLEVISVPPKDPRTGRTVYYIAIKE